MYININYVILIVQVIVNCLRIYYKEFSFLDIFKINFGYLIIFFHLHTIMFIYHLDYSYMFKINLITENLSNNFFINHEKELIREIVFNIPFIILLLCESIMILIFSLFYIIYIKC
jgi:hypothetical protein